MHTTYVTCTQARGLPGELEAWDKAEAVPEHTTLALHTTHTTCTTHNIHRPEGFLGELETWDKAEAALTEALNSTGLEWSINEADGAFYGPKIDITGG